MQTLTLLQKESSDKPLWRVLLFLFALFSGLGQASKVYAQDPGQSTANIRNVIVTTGTSSSSVSTTTYNAIPTTAGSSNFANRNFGALDVSTGRLLLQGGTVQITETDGETYSRAFIQYSVSAGTLSSTNTPFNSAQTIELTETSYDASTSVRTFSLNTAARNVLALATTGGASNRFDVSVGADGVDANNNDVSIFGSRRRSVFTATGTQATAAITANTILIAPDGNAANSYYFPNTGTNPQFPGNNFTSSLPVTGGGVTGAFDINNGQLRLTNATVTTTETGANSITSVVLYYRTRSTSSGGGAVQPITLTQSGSVTNGTRTFIIDPASTTNTNAQPNLIATPAVTAVGDYAVDIFFQANGINSSTGNTFSITYPPTGSSSPFTANFSVGGNPIATTIWTGATNDNWFDPNNWSAGVPTKDTNALIRDLGAGNSVPYPNIYSDYRYTTASGALIYDNTGKGPAVTRNFTMGGSSQASRSIARLVVGQLKVYGDFDNTYDSFIQRENTIMEFAGSNQALSGGSFVRVDISGGGTKALGGLMNISESLNFLTPNVYANATNPLAVNTNTTLDSDAGVLATDITQPSTNLVALADRATTNNNNGAQLNGETDNAYLYGFMRTSRLGVLVGEMRTYGNIGLDLTFTGSNSPGNVEITRNTVEAYTPLSDSYGIRRIFGVRPSDQQTNNGGLTATMVFHYRDSETVNLNGSTTRAYGSGSIPENRLTIFVSSNSGNTFSFIGRDGAVDEVNNTVTRTGVRTFATFTLGDIDHPLPVVLTAFNATRNGANAVLNWQTASEQNNKGFEVQVAIDGVNFTTLSFVASQAATTAQAHTYSYTDTELGKVGTRYYRLRQIDLDGTYSYSPIRTVSFDGAIASNTTLVASPNPFTNDIALSFNGNSPSGSAQLVLVDMTGRIVRQQTLVLSSASMSLGDLSGLRTGLYLAKVTLPDGSTKTVRVQKQ